MALFLLFLNLKTSVVIRTTEVRDFGLFKQKNFVRKLKIRAMFEDLCFNK